MTKYPKINTLFVRDEKTHKVIPGKIRCPEFSNIKNYLVTEKIDGTNVRVIYNQGNKFAEVIFQGRTDKAQMPPFLLEELKRMFSAIALTRTFVDASKPTEEMPQNVCLYGEGYGARIQKGGGNYREGVSFRLCDVWVDGWWLEWDNVVDVANKLEIKTVPKLYILEVGVRNRYANDYTVGIEDFESAKALVTQQKSVVAFHEKEKEVEAEGIVARAYPMVLFRNKTPVKWKLKRKDFG